MTPPTAASPYRRDSSAPLFPRGLRKDEGRRALRPSGATGGRAGFFHAYRRPRCSAEARGLYRSLPGAGGHVCARYACCSKALPAIPLTLISREDSLRFCTSFCDLRKQDGKGCLTALIIYQESTEPPGGSIALHPVALFLRFDTLLLFPTAQNVTISLPAKRDSHCPHLVKRSASSFARAVRSSSVT